MVIAAFDWSYYPSNAYAHPTDSLPPLIIVYRTLLSNNLQDNPQDRKLVVYERKLYPQECSD